MNLEKQVVNLKLAKKMNELNVNQDSYFFWRETDGELVIGNENNLMTRISAFTVSELGEMLPKRLLVNGSECSLSLWSNDAGEFWYCGYKNSRAMEISAANNFSKTEADSRAKMLIYLIENDLISVKDLK